MATTREELEAAIDAHPDQADNYLVLGDWLQEHHDPRGELIGLCRAKGMDRTEDAKARIAVLQRQLGPAPFKHGSMDWFYGFVCRYTNIVDEDDDILLPETLEHASLRHLTTLDLWFAGRDDDDRQWLFDYLAERPRECWRDVGVNSYWRGGGDPPAGEVDLTKLWAALSRVTRVFIAARRVTPGDVRSDTLIELEIDGHVAIAELAPLLAGSAPKLKSLVLHDVDPGGFALALETSKSSLPLTKLVLPHATEAVQQRIHAHYSQATFSLPYDGDRYERVGE